LVIALVVVVAAFCVSRLRTFFGVHDRGPITSGMADEIKPFNPSTWSMRCGARRSIANINYLDINAQPQRVSNAPLPWTLSVTT
ncbi:MmpS family transport accessory protein, partial [Mycobacterium szulgai]|uniref:MmpS family transport accessory protein n=1 Tax=Mycobacterium szulgai TaxID=1787 RepID=UPI0035576049|nr:transport acessory protein MmpS [Mycobacterium szulgai]